MSNNKTRPPSSAPIHGYSGKPLHQKMGLKEGMVCLVINQPENYAELLSAAEGVIFRKRSNVADVVHLFCATRAVLEKKIDSAISKTKPGGALWVSWPKKSSAMFIDLTEDQLREVILPTGWVDVKVCAVDENWSGLKFMKRRT